MVTVTQTEKGNRLFDVGNGEQARVVVDGVDLPMVVSCCPTEKWAVIMLYDSEGKPMLNAAGDAVFTVRIVVENMSIEALESIEPKETSRHG